MYQLTCTMISAGPPHPYDKRWHLHLGGKPGAVRQRSARSLLPCARFCRRPSRAEQAASVSLPTSLGVRRSRAHVAAVILSSLITFGLAASIAAAQSHLPPCPSDRNQVWTDCTGAYSSPDGSRYVGEFRDNKRNGQGALTFANGDKYVGEWSDGKENGQGTYTFLSGDKYVGEWWDGKRNGRGIETYADGREYVGEWRHGKKWTGHAHVAQWTEIRW
jgi:hypothetical protein